MIFVGRGNIIVFIEDRVEVVVIIFWWSFRSGIKIVFVFEDLRIMWIIGVLLYLNCVFVRFDIID